VEKTFLFGKVEWDYLRSTVRIKIFWGLRMRKMGS